MNHPLDLVVDRIARRKGVVFEFSKYIYKPQVLDDSRQVFSVNGEQLKNDRLKSHIDLLSAKEEIAIHSKLLINGRIQHIPMIDLACDLDVLAESYSILNALVFSKIKGNFFLYKSGNSAHVYGDRLIGISEWFRLQGLLLLCNLPGRPKIVDDRWIGHRIIARYSSLRLTCNSLASKQAGKIEPILLRGFSGAEFSVSE